MKYYGLYEETGAGDEILAVDTDKDNIIYQKENEYGNTPDLKIIEIDEKEYKECYNYLYK